MNFLHSHYQLIKGEKLREEWRKSRRRARIARTVACTALSAGILCGGLTTAAMALTGPYEPVTNETVAPEFGPGVLVTVPELTTETAEDTVAETAVTVPEETAAAITEAAAETTEEVAETTAAAAETTTAEETTAAAPQMTYAGEFLLTAYCSCPICCGKWSGGPTASGVMPKEGRTIAVDKRVIPLGTHVYIDGLGEFIAEDTGSAVKGNHIDVYMGSHTAAKWFAGGAGSCRRNVWIIADK